jgi:hypothetical protein
MQQSAPEPPDEPLLTRDQSAKYIREVLGRPMSGSTLDKLCSQGEGPQPAEIWGRRPLYTCAGLRAWCEARARKLVTPKAKAAQGARDAGPAATASPQRYSEVDQ